MSHTHTAMHRGLIALLCGAALALVAIFVAARGEPHRSEASIAALQAVDCAIVSTGTLAARTLRVRPETPPRAGDASDSAVHHGALLPTMGHALVRAAIGELGPATTRGLRRLSSGGSMRRPGARAPPVMRRLRHL